MSLGPLHFPHGFFFVVVVGGGFLYLCVSCTPVACVGSSQYSQWLEIYCLITFSAINIFGCGILEMKRRKNVAVSFWVSLVISY